MALLCCFSLCVLWYYEAGEARMKSQKQLRNTPPARHSQTPIVRRRCHPQSQAHLAAPLLLLLLPGFVGELGAFGFALTKHARQSLISFILPASPSTHNSTGRTHPSPRQAQKPSQVKHYQHGQHPHRCPPALPFGTLALVLASYPPFLLRFRGRGMGWSIGRTSMV